MFDKLKRIFSDLVDKISTREVSEKDLESLRDELLLSLVEADVAYEIAEDILDSLKKHVVGTRISRKSSVKDEVLHRLRDLIEQILRKSLPSKEFVSIISESISRGEKPVRIVFLGINGVGKTTTIAKVAHMLKNQGLKVLIVAADTFRAGAQEQLEIHAKRVGVPILKGKYGSDPGALVFDAIEHSRSRGYDVLLIDTAGRMHVDKDLMEELRKIVRIAKPNLKILILDALTGNDAIEQLKSFEEAVGVDGIVLAKIDADVKGGVALSIAGLLGKPIYFLGTGQNYDDLVPYDPDWIVNKVVSSEK